MKKTVVAALMTVLMMVSGAALGSFQTDYITIQHKLASTQEDYRVPLSYWTQSNLNDGTHRLMATVNDLFVYEISGLPVTKVTLAGELSNNEESGFELGKRMLRLLKAVGVSEDVAEEKMQSLLDSCVGSPGTKFFSTTTETRIELVYYQNMSMFLLTAERQ